MLRKLFIVILAGMLMISFSACTAKEEGAADSAEENGAAVVALVNDTEIQRIDFETMVENMKLSYLQFGIDFESEESKEILAMIEEEALNNLIQQQLLLQDALEKRYEVSKDEIDDEIKQIKSQFDNEEEFLAALEANQLTLDVLEKNVANDIMLEQYIQDEIGEPSASEEEIRAMYEEYSQTTEDAPTFEEMKLQLEENIKYQKFQVSFGELIENLEAKSSIEILL
ncbi:SurA N-terminal domain-containing protein [Anaerovirgula multivorans]|uniref:SurA N-terminal domain-containing protein n=1 Tax=Anaerovirgula multivorans TaxID=312168 RepID=A0A239EYJ2_9FIRM|nr:SurA N-terminal domain-containing protein [Anaerovirgula multivorans]SNS49689.1 SurA N-terminal domain-containing protein [Anaerovirgula multivorans]